MKNIYFRLDVDVIVCNNCLCFSCETSSISSSKKESSFLASELTILKLVFKFELPEENFRLIN